MSKPRDLPKNLAALFKCDKRGRLVCIKDVFSGQGKLERKAGSTVVGYLQNGYRKIKVNGRPIAFHRVVFFLVHGHCPPIIDHIDRNKENNSPKNLRVASKSLNTLNSNASRVSWRADRKAWHGRIMVNGVRFSTRYCKQKNEAIRLTRKLVADKLRAHL